MESSYAEPVKVLLADGDRTNKVFSGGGGLLDAASSRVAESWCGLIPRTFDMLFEVHPMDDHLACFQRYCR